MIEIKNLTVSFGGKVAVEKLNLTISQGEIVGIVGESGSGKSVSALSIMGLLSQEANIESGEICFDGQTLLAAGTKVDEKLMRSYRGDKMSMIFQEPMTSLNPTTKIGEQIDEMLILHGWEKRPLFERKEFILRTLESVGLKNSEKVYSSYPHQLSGGMRQRAMIAMAIILHPALVIADEPTTALDVTIQNQIVRLLQEINKKEKNAMIFITHDLNLARRICTKIVVMKDGIVKEIGDTEEIFNSPKDDYTRHLINAVPKRDFRASENKTKSSKIILEVKDLSVFYEDREGKLFGRKIKNEVVHNASFVLHEGETLGLVGESGCGKTSLCKAILGINKNITGKVENLTTRPQMIFQDPYSSLNPSKTIGWQLEEPLFAEELLGGKKLTKAERKEAAIDMLRMVGLDESYYYRKPSQLSGGQRQRVSIGQALITRPQLVFADEPVSALDVTIQTQILELMSKLQEEMGLAYLFISHDINVISQVCDRIMVMNKGQILEIGDTKEIFLNPRDAYTKELLAES